jgi:hypothetical protein
MSLYGISNYPNQDKAKTASKQGRKTTVLTGVYVTNLIEKAELPWMAI